MARRRTITSVDVHRTTGSSEVVDRLFVYATLRQGQTARALIANQILRSSAATTRGQIYVFPMGYAGFVAADERDVVGEVLWLSDLAATFGLLDAYEGDAFSRVLIQAQLDAGEPIWTWIYALADREAVRHGTLIEHGDWVRYHSDGT